MNKAIRDGKVSAPIVLGRDHHDVSGTDSPYRETSNIYDGSSFTADMAIHNVIGDSFRGAKFGIVTFSNGVLSISRLMAKIAPLFLAHDLLAIPLLTSQ